MIDRVFYRYGPAMKAGKLVGSSAFREMKSSPLVIEGWEEYDFVVVKWLKGEFRAFDGKSGIALGTSEKCMEDVISSLKERLDCWGKERFDELISMSIKKFGKSPRYEEKPGFGFVG